MTVFNHIGHRVADLDRATRFWCDVLGFEVDRPDVVIPDGIMGPMFDIDGPVGLTARYLRCGEYVHELIWFDRPAPEPERHSILEAGLTHVSLCVDDVDATVALVREHGGEVVSASRRAAVVRDPEGQLIELLPMTYREALG